jgi:hypothetical protein
MLTGLRIAGLAACELCREHREARAIALRGNSSSTLLGERLPESSSPPHGSRHRPCRPRATTRMIDARAQAPANAQTPVSTAKGESTWSAAERSVATKSDRVVPVELWLLRDFERQERVLILRGVSVCSQCRRLDVRERRLSQRGRLPGGPSTSGRALQLESLCLADQARR